jgi:triacylglycerol lipase
MGGLDARRVIARSARLQRRIKRLITIATPHFGSPVANAVLAPPTFLSFSPLQRGLGLFSHDAGALHDLQTRSNLQDADVPGVEYLCIGCDAPRTNSSILFDTTALLGGLSGNSNDGVMSLSSSSKTNDTRDLWARWPADHGGAIGWPSGTAGAELAAAAINAPAGHIERYREVLKVLVA